MLDFFFKSLRDKNLTMKFLRISLLENRDRMNLQYISTRHFIHSILLSFSGVRYVELTSKLIELLLEYRATKISNDSRENQMSCIVNLLTFYSDEYKRDDLYVKYLKELATLHEKCHNQAEAGFTILR